MSFGKMVALADTLLFHGGSISEINTIVMVWSTLVPSFMLLHINPQFLHNFHISAGLTT